MRNLQKNQKGNLISKKKKKYKIIEIKFKDNLLGNWMIGKQGLNILEHLLEQNKEKSPLKYIYEELT